MTTGRSVLVVEDEQGERDALARLLRMEQYRVFTARDPDEALEYIEGEVGLVISDVRMGKGSGIDLLRSWRRRRPQTPFIMATAYGDVDSAVAAMKLGAEDYLTKPVDPEALLQLVRRMIARNDTATRAAEKKEPCDGPAGRRILGQSAAMVDVFERVRRAAPTDSLVLILGESGTGKELIASAIHEQSRRKAGAYIAVNIAALPESLVEAELFGYVPGAFTGAERDRIGRFEAADGGTLFIDEIGDFPLSAQAKLLRVLDNLSVNPVGSNEDRRVDVRLVAATSRNLAELVARGDFRADLFYRLNVLTVELPPLRDRHDDIPLLMDAFLAAACQKYQRPWPTMSPELIQFILAYDWPGNVRQLRNAIENMVVMSNGGTLSLGDLPAYLSGNSSLLAKTADRGGANNLRDMERTAILSVLERCGGNRTHAAEALGISVRTLQRKLKVWGLNASQPDPEAA
ncbi:MAG TPA: sigma-54 dependent transcriptional regulator [Pirellulales bacterium]|nr:sigma-54 dependent transcriptional regulator [Pirellulales bacterium]